MRNIFQKTRLYYNSKNFILEMKFLMTLKPLNGLSQYTHLADLRHNSSTPNTCANGFFLHPVQSNPNEQVLNTRTKLWFRNDFFVTCIPRCSVLVERITNLEPAVNNHEFYCSQMCI
jgi:hypothetical protein